MSERGLDKELCDDLAGLLDRQEGIQLARLRQNIGMLGRQEEPSAVERAGGESAGAAPPAQDALRPSTSGSLTRWMARSSLDGPSPCRWASTTRV